jgi:hypothetical protein
MAKAKSSGVRLPLESIVLSPIQKFQLPNSPVCIDSAQAPPANIPSAQPQQRRNGKSMRRRSGQNGTIVANPVFTGFGGE